jgi:hypothetical protein
MTVDRSGLVTLDPMARPAAARTVLGSGRITFEHWALDPADEPALAAAESACRTAVRELLTRLPVTAGPLGGSACDEATLLARRDDPDGWSDIAVRPELSDLVALHRGELKAEPAVTATRDAVGRAMEEAAGRRGWCPTGTGWDVSGHLWYRAGTTLGWHTNTRVPGWRAYLSWTAEAGSSFFRYWDPEHDRVVTSWDTGLDLRLFHVSTEEPFWHCVSAGADRHSFGYRLVDVIPG